MVNGMMEAIMTILERIERLEKALGIGAPEPRGVIQPNIRIRKLLGDWRAAHGSEWVTSREATPLIEAYEGISEPSARKVHSVLTTVYDRPYVIDGKTMMIRHGTRSKAAVWRLVER